MRFLIATFRLFWMVAAMLNANEVDLDANTCRNR